MIYTLALMLFPELLGALRLMMFLANPTTWTDIRRIDPATKERRRSESPALETNGRVDEGKGEDEGLEVARETCEK